MQTVADKSTVSTAPKSAGPFFNSPMVSAPATFIQPKLTVNNPDDLYEREADAVADKVLSMGDAAIQKKPLPVTPVQRKCAACEEEEKKGIQRKCAHCEAEEKKAIQRKCDHCEEEDKKAQRKEKDTAPVAANTQLESYVSNLSGGGQSLSDEIRSYYEPRFGHDFSSVRVHTDTVATKSAQSINALAYTSGSNIVFNSGQYAPASDTGKRLLAHELTHVVQQGAGTPKSIQKQEGDEGTGAATGAGAATPSFGTTPPEPGCPTNPTRLGDVTPEPPCEQSDTEIDGQLFYFCRSSDVFKDPADANRLVSFVRSQRANSTFEVHAYASQESTNTYNINLACHRAKRAARSMINAGVRSERIHTVNKGPTTRFGAGMSEQQLQLNRVVVVKATPQEDTPAGELPTDRMAIVNMARQKLLNGEYNLGADAYISMWTCGTIPSISEAVRRTTVIIEDSPGSLTPNTMGHPTHLGLNTIALIPESFAMANVLECIMARIVDMSFHHMARPQIPDPGEVHGAAIFLVALAGLQPCRTPDSPDLPNMPGTGSRGRTTWNAPANDPMTRQPTCTATQLAGPQVTGDRAAIGRTAPTFMPAVTARNRSGNSIIEVNDDFVRMSSPAGAMSIQADVTMTGNAADFSNYTLGFMQTIAENDVTIDYVSGHRLNMILPLPIRDGRPDARGGAEPWFDPANNVTPDSSGNVTVTMSDSPAQMMGREYLDIDRSTMESMVLGDGRSGNTPHRARMVTQAGNVLNRASMRVVFNTWLVARRNGASLDAFDTHFLDGTQIAFNMNVDMVGDVGTGQFGVVMDQSPGSANMQFRNPVPADIRRPAIQMTKTDPAPRQPVADTTAELQELRRFHAEVNRIAEPIRLRRGLTDRLTAVIRLDRATGRLIISTPNNRAVTVSGERVIPQDQLDAFAEELYDNIRKDSVVGGRLTTVTVALHSLTSATVRPATFTPLINRPGIKDMMRTMWDRSVADPLNVREHSVTVVINRDNGRMIFITREGPPETEGGGNSVAICLSGDAILPLNSSVLGTIHTHPDPDGRQEPSDPDLQNVHDNPARCGSEHYVIAEEFIHQFTGDTRSRVGRRDALLNH